MASITRFWLFLSYHVHLFVFGNGFYQAKILDRCGLSLDIGTPAQKFLVFISPMATELIVSDFRCAIRLDECPKYCVDSKFSELYCDVRCWSITEQERQLHCGKYNERMYYPNASSTYKSVLDPTKPPINWTATYKDFRTFYGVYSYDLVQFQGFLDPNSDKDNLKITDSRFISGLMLDSRIFTTFTGIFGMAPPLDGEHFIVKAKRAGNITNAIITVDGNYNVVTFGQLEDEKCQNWTGIKPLVGNQWVLQAESIELINKKLIGLNTVLIDPCLATIAVPSRVINKLLDDKIIFKRNVTNDTQYPFTAKCNALIPLKFTFGGTEFVFKTVVVNPMKTEGKHLFSWIKHKRRLQIQGHSGVDSWDALYK